MTVILGVVWPPGDHEYVPPGWLGVAVKTAESPSQIVTLLTLTVGDGSTITVISIGLPTHEIEDGVTV